MDIDTAFALGIVLGVVVTLAIFAGLMAFDHWAATRRRK